MVSPKASLRLSKTIDIFQGFFESKWSPNHYAYLRPPPSHGSVNWVKFNIVIVVPCRERQAREGLHYRQLWQGQINAIGITECGNYFYGFNLCFLFLQIPSLDNTFNLCYEIFNNHPLSYPIDPPHTPNTCLLISPPPQSSTHPWWPNPPMHCPHP